MPRTPRVAARVTAAAVAALMACLAPASSALAPASSAVTQVDDGEAPFTLDRTLHDHRIKESSGLARSNYARALVFTHNDSGDRPRVFAASSDGRTRAILRLSGAGAVDWEDISTGPARTLWVGDIGDNSRRRSTISVYRIREPVDVVSRSVRWKRYRFAYRDGRHDAEALMVHPRNGRVYVVTKESSTTAGIYRAPRRLSSRAVNRLSRVASAPSWVTAGSFSRRGGRFVLGNYTKAYLYRGFRNPPIRQIELPSTQQGESIEFARDRTFLLRGSEGTDSPVYRIRLR